METSINDSKEEDTKWIEYRKEHSVRVRDDFIKQYMPLVKYVAGKVSVGMPGNVEWEDLVSFGQFGLLDAIEKYDPAKGVKFKTYAVTRIRGAIFDELRQIDWVPRSVRQKSREIEGAINSVEAKLGRTASDSEIAKELGISDDEYHKAVMKVSGTSVMSLDEAWRTGDDYGSVSIGDSIESPESLNPDKIVEQEEVKRILEQAIKELPDREKKVVVLYYFQDLTFKEIGQALEVSESRISQLHTKAILRLRAKLTSSRKGIF